MHRWIAISIGLALFTFSTAKPAGASGNVASFFIKATLLRGVAAALTGTSPVHDPFRILVKPQKPFRPPNPIEPHVVTPPPRPRLRVKILAIAGEAPNYVAVLQYKGKEFIVEKEDEAFDKSFKVVDIDVDRVECYYKPTRSRVVIHY